MWSRRAGEMQVLDARTFINSSLDADADAEPLDGPTVYAVHCTADFNAKRPWGECNHWVPGWHVEDLGMDKARQLHREWMSLQQKLHEDAMLDLHEQEMNAVMDPDLQAALRNDIKICEDRSMRLELMSHKLFLEHGIIFHDVVADGNCGIETVACWERGPEIWQTPDGDMKRLREELQSAWLSTIEVPYWRGVFLQYLSGLALPGAPPPPADNQPETSEAAPADNQPETSEAAELQATPPKRDSKRDCPFTPDPVEKRAKLLPDVEDEQGDVLVVPGKDDEQAQKKRRTGKPNPIDTKVNFETYLQQWLSSKGIIYKTWVADHKKCFVIVFPGLDLVRPVAFGSEMVMVEQIQWSLTVWPHIDHDRPLGS